MERDRETDIGRHAETDREAGRQRDRQLCRQQPTYFDNTRDVTVLRIRGFKSDSFAVWREFLLICSLRAN